MIVDETNRRIEESLPLTKPIGKIRVETRGTHYEYGQPFASHKSRFTPDNYIEWRISYDTGKAPSHKIRDPLRRYNAEGPEGLRDRQSLDTILRKTPPPLADGVSMHAGFRRRLARRAIGAAQDDAARSDIPRATRRRRTRRSRNDRSSALNAAAAMSRAARRPIACSPRIDDRYR